REREGQREGEIERQRGGEGKRRKVVISFPLSVPLSLCLSISLSLCLSFSGCSRPRPDPEAEKRAAVDEFFARVGACRPSNEQNQENAGSLRLAVESVVNAAMATHVRLIAYAPDQAVDFYLPIYRTSAGQWLINEKGRAYLLDERCREIKLKDRKHPT